MLKFIINKNASERFSSEIRKILKNSYFEEHLQTTAFDLTFYK